MPVEGALFPIFVRKGRSRKKFKTGHINKNGDVVVPPTLDYGYPFREGLASLWRNAALASWLSLRADRVKRVMRKLRDAGMKKFLRMSRLF